MLYRFPNVVVGQVTRESVQQAIANGITAQQVWSDASGQLVFHYDWSSSNIINDKRKKSQMHMLKKYVKLLDVIQMVI